VFNLRLALVAAAVTVVAATVVMIVWFVDSCCAWVAPLAAPTPLLFTGDYATGDFSQWLYVQNKDYNGDSAGYRNWGYPASIVTDSGRGYSARYELRSDDFVGPIERSEVAGGSATTGGTEGQIRWYRFSTKFDATFPQNHASLGWG
jgi:hypothetical protein